MTNSNTSLDLFSDADVIAGYSRAEAIADGVLIDLTRLAKEYGILFPVAMTAAAHRVVVALSPMAERMGNDEEGRAWDVLTMLKCRIRDAKQGEDRLLFSVACITGNEHPSQIELKAVCGPGDDARPVITILLPDED